VALHAGPAASASPWAARLARPWVYEGRPGEGDALSAYPERESARSGLDTVAGLMSATAIFLGLLGATDFDLSISGTHLEMRPIRVGLAAIVLALVAAGLGGRHRRLAGAAVAIAGACWVIGMIIAVVTERPLF
jgi:hypothetical protein